MTTKKQRRLAWFAIFTAFWVFLFIIKLKDRGRVAKLDLDTAGGTTAISLEPKPELISERTLTPSHPAQPADDELTTIVTRNTQSIHLVKDQELPLLHGTKKFLYLIETERCLSDTLLQALGDSNDCNCELIVLSLKECAVPPPEHMEYITNNYSTWGTGRNMLYEASKRRTHTYLYYIFADDSIDLISKSNVQGSGWRMFEDFLVRIEPAIGIADCSKNLRVPMIYHRRKKLKCLLSEPAEYIPSPRFEVCLNAFHHDAVHHVLPYSTRLDKISWWLSALCMETKCEVVFPGQVVLHTDIVAMTHKHRSYRKKVADARDLSLIFTEVETTVPEKYRNASILRELKKNGLRHEAVSPTYCLPPPYPHEPIVPYRLTV